MTNSSQTITTADAACAFNFPGNQGKNYEKTEFVMHSRVAELVADQLGHVFYDDSENDWLIRASHLRDMVLINILQEEGGGEGSSTLYSQYPIYGSAIAFEPGVWTKIVGLDEGVTYPAASKACLEDVIYCTTEAADHDNLQLTEMNRNNDGMELYCPYAFRGPQDESVYENCSRAQPEFCPSMDLAFAYDYSDVTLAEAEWYTVSRFIGSFLSWPFNSVSVIPTL